MEWWLWVLIVGIAITIALVIGTRQRRTRLRERFGPEYERTVERADNTRQAEHDLRDRLKQHRKLELRPLTPDAAAEYSRQWFVVQSRFVDAPESACSEAGDLIDQVLRDRGYPVDEDFGTQADLVSVDHPNLVGDYRTAREATASGSADTEALRVAFVAYRDLFADMLDDQGGNGSRSATEHRKVDHDELGHDEMGHDEVDDDEMAVDHDHVDIDLAADSTEAPLEPRDNPDDARVEGGPRSR